MPILTKILILPIALAVLASCVPNPAVVNDRCAGWRPIYLLAPSVDYLAKNDPAALKGLIGHKETGQAKSCWK